MLEFAASPTPVVELTGDYDLSSRDVSINVVDAGVDYLSAKGTLTLRLTDRGELEGELAATLVSDDAEEVSVRGELWATRVSKECWLPGGDGVSSDDPRVRIYSPERPNGPFCKSVTLR